MIGHDSILGDTVTAPHSFRKYNSVELQAVANVRLLQERTRVRDQRIQVALGWVATYAEALEKAKSALEHLEELQDSDLRMLRDSLAALEQIKVEKDKIIRDINEYRRIDPIEFGAS